MELIIMAAGMGSRFGGLKQIEPVDKNGNFIIDYSIYDAIRCGFDKVIFIIKKENLEIFESTIANRIKKHIKVEYAFQDNNYPEIPSDRTKPLGTGHAVLSAKDLSTDSFAVINADDYYGYDALKQIAEFLKTNENENKYALVGYNVANTMSGPEPVKRGVCKCDNGKLQSITESSVEKIDDKLFATSLETNVSEKKMISNNTIVSMNMFGFTNKFFTHLSLAFEKFLASDSKDLETKEFFLPTVVSDLIKSNKATVEVLSTTSTWHGITYKQDKERVVSFLASQVENGIYPSDLWNN